ALAISFSSTIIIMKLLSDKGDISTLYGKISIGFLIVQDIIAILILMFVSSLSNSGSFSSFAFEKFSIGAGSIIILFLISFYILPRITRKVAKNQELLLLFSIGWAFALGSFFDYIGFSMEIGALLAGISLSISPFRYEIGSRMKPLRDFFLLLFFILLGSQLSFSSLSGMHIPIIIFSLLIFIGNPIIVMFLMGRLGYTKRNGFLAGLTVSQISEFSFILITLGIKLNHLSPEILSIMTLIGLITMGGSAYFVPYGNKLYHFFAPYLNCFERKGLKKDEGKFYRGEDYDILLFGYNRIGYSLVKSFKNIKKRFLIVDNNPEIILNLAKSGINCQYGDAEDIELLQDLPLRNAKMIVSTIPDFETNILLVKKIHAVNKEAIIIAVSHGIEDALKLYSSGATYVVLPHFLGGTYTSNLIEENLFAKENFVREGLKNIEELKARRKQGHHDIIHEKD
ncbi:MAG: cation:proton antiporter family protein, partial [Nanoarchaeota archaeon]